MYGYKKTFFNLQLICKPFASVLKKNCCLTPTGFIEKVRRSLKISILRKGHLNIKVLPYGYRPAPFKKLI